MAKLTHQKDLEKLLSESEDQRRRMQDTGEKIEKLFAQIQSESAPVTSATVFPDVTTPAETSFSATATRPVLNKNLTVGESDQGENLK